MSNLGDRLTDKIATFEDLKARYDAGERVAWATEHLATLNELKGVLNDAAAVNADGAVTADVDNSVTTTDELSFNYDGTQTFGEQVIYRHEDTDTATPFSMDTGQMPEHDNWVVEGLLGGHDGSPAYKPAQIRFNGTTGNNYRYRYRDPPSIGRVSGAASLKDEFYSNRPFHARWEISGSATTTGVDASIRSNSAGTYQRRALVEGSLGGESYPVTRLEVFTDFNCTGRLVVKGVDY